ncbi:MAG: hypothetical protein HY645_14170 [Acidobacteria bacterium]|nr:hypothetical protein [Acidobacteriota bacterium]
MFNYRNLLSALVFVFIAACGGGAREESAETPPEQPSQPAAATPMDAAQAATLSGKVSFTGPAPKGVRLRMDQDAACAKQHSGPVMLQEVRVGEAGGLQDVFVWVKEGLQGKSFETPREEVVLDQKACIYEPRVVGLVTGQNVKILNSDPTTHNVHPLPKQNREWNQSQPPNAAPLVKTFAREEIMIPVKCNVHPWMKSYIGVVSHPFFAVTRTDGTFEIKGLPPGEYTIQAWHEKLGTVEQKVTLGAQETKSLEFTFSG